MRRGQSRSAAMSTSNRVLTTTALLVPTGHAGHSGSLRNAPLPGPSRHLGAVGHAQTPAWRREAMRCLMWRISDAPLRQLCTD